jgi:hypothetical protein
MWPARANALIVFICGCVADKISGGRSPNDQAFESASPLPASPYGPWRRRVFRIRIQTGRIALEKGEQM